MGSTVSPPLANPTKELLSALAAFQKTVLAAHKDNTTGRFRYASEQSINSAIAPIKAEGIAHTFTFKPLSVSDGETIGHTEVTLTIYHANSGGSIDSSMVVPDYDPKNARDSRHQQRGSAISYAKRYLLAAAFGLATEENEGECTLEEVSGQSTPQKTAANKIAPAQAQQPKSTVPSIASRREAAKQKLNSFAAKDDGIFALFQQAVRETPSLNITADKPTLANMTTDEQMAWLEEWIKAYELQMSLNQ